MPITDADVDCLLFSAKRRVTFERSLQVRRCLLQLHLDRVQAQVDREFLKLSVASPGSYPRSTICEGRTVHLIDRQKQRNYSEFLRRSGMRLPECVRLLWGGDPQRLSTQQGTRSPAGHGGLEDVCGSREVGMHRGTRSASTLAPISAQSGASAKEPRIRGPSPKCDRQESTQGPRLQSSPRPGPGPLLHIGGHLL